MTVRSRSNSQDVCNVCFRLLAQLDETENAFEQFWCKHHLKLEQCLQLRHFEQDFREVRLRLTPNLWFLPVSALQLSNLTLINKLGEQFGSVFIR